MAKYRFSTIERIAIWEAFGKRCVYSGEPLSYADLEIDHILPEMLNDDERELKGIRVEYGLDPSFEINSFLNWIPVSGRLNRQKGRLLFQPPTAHYFLGMARARHAKTLELHEYHRKRIQQEGILPSLGAAIELGVLSRKDAINYINRLSEGERFDLVREIRFIGQHVNDQLSTRDHERLWQLTVEHGDPHEAGLELVDGKGNQVRVYSCSEFAHAKASGYYARTTYAMKMESFFNQTCGTLDALARARTPERSYIANPRVGVLDLDLMPVSVLFALDPDRQESLVQAGNTGQTVQDWVDAGDVQIKRVSQYAIHWEFGGMRQALWEILRADFNDDGIEDLLYYSYGSAIGGTFGYGDVRFLTRRGSSEPFSSLVDT